MILEQSKERILAGWCKGEAEDSNGNVCMVGAVDRTNGDLKGSLGDFLATTALLERIIKSEYPDRIKLDDDGMVIATFNDHPLTTLDDVVKVFDKAIAQ